MATIEDDRDRRVVDHGWIQPLELRTYPADGRTAIRSISTK
jgi:hypothetical protein